MRTYDTPFYRRVRKYLNRLHLVQGSICVRCGELIPSTEPFDVGHVDGDPSTIAGPEHRRCNRATGGRRKKRSREW